MSDHSPEPWEVGALTDDGESHECYYIQMPDDDSDAASFDAVAMTSEWCGIEDIDQAKANAERIVACVNAMAGIPTKDLVSYAQSRNKRLADGKLVRGLTIFTEVLLSKVCPPDPNQDRDMLFSTYEHRTEEYDSRYDPTTVGRIRDARQVACMDAMIGIPDPQAFVEAAKRAVDEYERYYGTWCMPSGMQDLEDAMKEPPCPEK